MRKTAKNSVSTPKFNISYFLSMGGGGAGFFKPENFGNCLFLSSLYIPGYLTPEQILDIIINHFVLNYFLSIRVISALGL